MNEQEQVEQRRTFLRKAGPWPMEAYDFVQRGLAETAHKIHEHADSFGEQDRHVTGQELCLGLRDFAIDQYGLLAPMVLELWHIRRTEDFGKMVFAMIDLGLMQRRPEDSMDDFRAVYDFREAFDQQSLRERIGEPQPG
ncbi:MAG: hypothetical protein MK101_03510 [Phycisphaerales bacterium]|nr:hypothetical protein [Phycisphaerales bacterium]